MTERVLLAGCGDLGVRVARLLVARGDMVFALRRRPPARAADNVHWLAADLTDPASLDRLPPGMTQLVYLPTPDRRDAAAYRAVFVDGLRTVLAAPALAGLQRTLLVSSSAVYGECEDAVTDEDTPPAPQAFNGEVLLEAERWLAAQRVPSVVLRLAGLYGPERMQLLQRLRAGAVQAPRAIVHWANRIHVDDAARAVAHLLALPTPRSLYLGVDDTPLPLHVLYDRLAELVGVPLPVEGVAPAGVGSKRLSNARLRASGWRPQWPDAREGYAALIRADTAG